MNRTLLSTLRALRAEPVSPKLASRSVVAFVHWRLDKWIGETERDRGWWVELQASAARDGATPGTWPRAIYEIVCEACEAERKECVA
jgi:hypothetical protein